MTTTKRKMTEFDVDYTRCATMPVRDMARDGKIAFMVDVYGVDQKDLAVVPDGGAPMLKAVERIGLDPNRFQSVVWDADGSGVIMGGELFHTTADMRKFATNVRRR